ncbi:chloride channel [Branchiostoma belcheri]|nr:chloride channel [Branchiostoma belcheri]
MSALCWIVLLSAFGWHSEAVFTRPNEIKLQNNEYTDVLVAINPNIPEDQQIVDRIEFGPHAMNEETLLCPKPCLSQTVPERAQNGTQPDCPEPCPENCARSGTVRDSPRVSQNVDTRRVSQTMPRHGLGHTYNKRMIGAEILTEASQDLYVATNNRTFFREIKILIPNTWTRKPEYQPAGTETFDRANIRVDLPNPQYGDNPYVQQKGGCGEEGDYMHLTPKYVVEKEYGVETWGPNGKTFVHEWGHLRWGLFDEYGYEDPSGESYPHFYRPSVGGVQPTRCSAKVDGTHRNMVTGARCQLDPTTGVYEPECRFYPLPQSNQATASYMFMHFLDKVTGFCHSDPEGDPLSYHNREAPNKQNVMCQGQSTWDVMNKHQDFANGANPPRAVQSTKPDFVLLQESEFVSIVLVLDVSSSMNGEPLRRLVQVASRFIRSVVSFGTSVGVVTFSSSSSPTAGRIVRRLKGDPIRGRLGPRGRTLLWVLFTSYPPEKTDRAGTSGDTEYPVLYSIFITRAETPALGVARALAVVFEQASRLNMRFILARKLGVCYAIKPSYLDFRIHGTHGKTEYLGARRTRALEAVGPPQGGVLLLVTDGGENQSPRISDVIPELIRKRVIVSTIAIGPSADDKLENLAQQTGGSSFVSGTDESTALDNAFTTTFEEKAGTKGVKILSEDRTIGGRETYSSHVYVDTSVGEDTTFSVSWLDGRRPGVTLEPPVGPVITEGDPIYDVTSDTITIEIPGTAKPGKWAFNITNTAPNDQDVTIIVTSNAVNDTEPIKVTAQVSAVSLDYSSSQPTALRVYASVRKGYLPVIGATVTAFIEKPDGQVEEITLLDNGAGADVTKNDGIYSRYFFRFTANGRYGFSVNANNSQGNAGYIVINRGRGNGALPIDPGNSTWGDNVQQEPLEQFQRMTTGGVCQVQGVPSGGISGQDILPPSRVDDLTAVEVSFANATVKMNWTALGDDFDQGGPAHYVDIRYSRDFDQLADNFYGSASVNQSQVLQGNLTSLPEPGSTMTVVILVPDRGHNVTFVFALCMCDEADNCGRPSNIVTANLEFIPEPVYIHTNGTPTGVIVGSVLAVVFVVILVLIFFVWRSRSAVPKATDRISSHRDVTHKSVTKPMEVTSMLNPTKILLDQCLREDVHHTLVCLSLN